MPLIEKHEREKKRRAGIIDNARGRKSAALDARGACLGSLGLACFAIALWRSPPIWAAALDLIVALAIWLALSVLLWRVARIHYEK
jgi:hypothetical protein